MFFISSFQLQIGKIELGKIWARSSREYFQTSHFSALFVPSVKLSIGLHYLCCFSAAVSMVVLGEKYLDIIQFTLYLFIIKISYIEHVFLVQIK